MLSMNYFDKNGNKWSIEKGDWVSPLAGNHRTGKYNYLKFTGRKIFVILLVLAAVLTFISIT
jgi:hypothetical protein